jgi:hypothetical protein
MVLTFLRSVPNRNEPPRLVLHHAPWDCEAVDKSTRADVAQVRVGQGMCYESICALVTLQSKEDAVMSRIRDAEHSQILAEMRRHIAELEIEVSFS